MILFYSEEASSLHIDEKPQRPSAVRLFSLVLSSTIISPAQPAATSSRVANLIDFCLCVPCITSPAKPNGRCDARITRQRALGQPYRGMWKKKHNNWVDFFMALEKICHIECHVRDMWPNPPNVPYQGHCRSWKVRCPNMLFLACVSFIMDKPHYALWAQQIIVVLCWTTVFFSIQCQRQSLLRE